MKNKEEKLKEELKELLAINMLAPVFGLCSFWLVWLGVSFVELDFALDNVNYEAMRAFMVIPLAFTLLITFIVLMVRDSD